MAASVTSAPSLAARRRRSSERWATATVAPELPEASVTPTLEPGLVATPENQTEQDVQTRNVDGDTVDSLRARIQAVEHELLPNVVRELCAL